MADIGANAVSALEQRRQQATLAEAQHIRKLRRGTLITVKYQEGGQTKWAWYYEDKKQRELFLTTEETAAFFADSSTSIIDKLVDVPTISAIIALIMTGILAYYIVSFPQGTPPHILDQALLLILGFYFGSKTSSA